MMLSYDHVISWSYNFSATGDGEKIMQFCPSFHIVQLMRSGRSPQEACEEVVAHMKKESDVKFEVGVVAVSTKVRSSCRVLVVGDSSDRMFSTFVGC